jgi:hypothetical protein
MPTRPAPTGTAQAWLHHLMTTLPAAFTRVRPRAQAVATACSPVPVLWQALSLPNVTWPQRTVCHQCAQHHRVAIHGRAAQLPQWPQQLRPGPIHWSCVGPSQSAQHNDGLVPQVRCALIGCRMAPAPSASTDSCTGTLWLPTPIRPTPNTLCNGRAAQLCRTNGRWVEMTSVHWYKATAEMNVTAAQLLEEEPIRKEMENLKVIVGVSNRCVL